MSFTHLIDVVSNLGSFETGSYMAVRGEEHRIAVFLPLCVAV